jgi:hypothetical protein
LPPFRKSIAHEGLQRLYGLIGLPSARLGVRIGRPVRSLSMNRFGVRLVNLRYGPRRTVRSAAGAGRSRGRRSGRVSRRRSEPLVEHERSASRPMTRDQCSGRVVPVSDHLCAIRAAERTSEAISATIRMRRG